MAIKNSNKLKLVFSCFFCNFFANKNPTDNLIGTREVPETDFQKFGGFFYFTTGRFVGVFYFTLFIPFLLFFLVKKNRKMVEKIQNFTNPVFSPQNVTGAHIKSYQVTKGENRWIGSFFYRKVVWIGSFFYRGLQLGVLGGYLGLR